MKPSKLYSVYSSICEWSKHGKYVGVSSFSPGERKLRWETSIFDEVVQLEFENRTISCPKEYDKRLRVQYGDYMKIVKNVAAHSNLTINPDKSYLDYL